MICTFVYARTEGDDAFLKEIVKIVKRNNGRVYFVQLCADVDTLKKRLKGKSRREYGKLKSFEKLQGIMKKYDLFEPVGFAKSFRIDNTDVAARDAARMIKAHYGL